MPTDSTITPELLEPGSMLIVVLLLTLPFVPVALLPLAVRFYYASPPDLKREKLKAMNAYTMLMIVLWCPVIAEATMENIHTDGRGWWLAVLGLLLFTPVIILCARSEERLFTTISVRLLGKNKCDEPRTVPTVAVMLILNLVQIVAASFGFTAFFMFLMFWR